MRLISATVRNYRIIGELTVNFDRVLTLVGGANESGKSTLAEAIHRALFLKAKGNTEYHRAMLSSPFIAAPQVELVFEAENETYHLKKRFGASGTTALESGRSVGLQGSQAEDELARLLKLEAACAGRGAVAQWGHLWVWQGRAGDDPSLLATVEKADLIKQLQAIGGAAVLQSELDSKMARHFAAKQAQLFVSNGKAKAGSELYRAQENKAQADQLLAQARERMDKLTGALAKLERASAALAGAKVALAKLEAEQAGIAQQERQLAVLRQQEAEQAPVLKSAQERLEEIVAAERMIRESQLRIAELGKDLTPQQEQIERSRRTLSEARQLADQSVQEFNVRACAVRAARLRRDLVVAAVASIEKNEHHAQLASLSAKATARQIELVALETEISSLPEIDKSTGKRLQKLELEISHARTALQAMATGIEVISASEPIMVGVRQLSTGAQEILTESAEISIGSGVRLRIQPGGGSSLSQARQHEIALQNELRDLLDSVALNSVKEVFAAQAKREELSQKAQAIKAELQGMGAEGLAERLRKAEADQVTARKQLERLKPLAGEVSDIKDLHSAKAELGIAETTLSEAESKEGSARMVMQQATSQVAQGENSLKEKNQEIEQQRQQMDRLQGQLDFLLRTHGDAPAIAQALQMASAGKTAAESRLKATREAILALQPDFLASDSERIARAAQFRASEREAAQREIVEAESELRYDGSLDPKAQLILAEARAAAAAQYEASLHRTAQAVSLLNELFQEEQRRLSETFTRPLADKITGYIQCVLGSGAKVIVNLDESGFNGLRLARPQEGAGVYDFVSLSGGAREQVSAGVRLAMAELLAADHGGVLPVIFDDAFTNTDGERVNRVQRMLDLAATRNLQIIVLTCNPMDYATLGAKTTMLNRETTAVQAP